MPFIGVLPERRSLFQPQPRADIGVSDAAAWRLNSTHRQIYDKLAVALGQGMLAAPCGVSPMDMGLAPEQPVFVKPITNLAGMSIAARQLHADQLAAWPGLFWCELLEGEHVSSDALLLDGRVQMMVHTLASAEKDQQRALWWRVGVALPDQDARVRGWLEAQLPGYTGLCNVETIDGRVIEAHLRGSNGFFDFYGEQFMRRWVALVDEHRWDGDFAIPGGMVASVFGDAELGDDAAAIAAEYGVSIAADPHCEGRIAIIRGGDPEQVLAARLRLLSVI